MEKSRFWDRLYCLYFLFYRKSFLIFWRNKNVRQDYLVRKHKKCGSSCAKMSLRWEISVVPFALPHGKNRFWSCSSVSSFSGNFFRISCLSGKKFRSGFPSGAKKRLSDLFFSSSDWHENGHIQEIFGGQKRILFSFSPPFEKIQPKYG